MTRTERAQSNDRRSRYCHECGQTFAGPLTAASHECADRPDAMAPWLRRIPARWPAKEVTR
jgi:hypothetical protein